MGYIEDIQIGTSNIHMLLKAKLVAHSLPTIENGVQIQSEAKF